MTRYNYEFTYGSTDDRAPERENSLFDTPSIEDSPFEYLLIGGRAFTFANGGFRAVPCDHQYAKKALGELDGHLVFQYKLAE